jgi:16S rRNA (guanine966-N2)-methyltransferase
VRVSGGTARGKSLTAAPGTRPTTDRVRQAIFNVLAPLVEHGRGADLYAGSGALGIEALSRGVIEHCTFIESRNIACRSIRTNLESAGFEGAADVICSEAAPAVRRIRGPLSLVFADPPYADDRAVEPLHALEEHLTPGAIVVLEHSGKREPPAVIGGLPAMRSKRYGDSAVTFYGRGG